MDTITLGDGPNTVVALHGIQGTRDAWLPVAKQLSSHARFILPNLRGRGSAVRCASVQDYSLREYAHDVEEVVRSTLDGRPFVLAGWSMGVSVALQYVAIASGPQPRQLVLLSGTPKLCDAKWFHGEQGDLMNEIANREARLGLRNAADHNAVALTWLAIRDSDQRPLLSNVEQPTLVVHGREDEDSPWDHGVELSSGLPNARLVSIDGAGHSLLTANTAHVCDELLQLFEKNGNYDAT